MFILIPKLPEDCNTTPNCKWRNTVLVEYLSSSALRISYVSESEELEIGQQSLRNSKSLSRRRRRMTMMESRNLAAVNRRSWWISCNKRLDRNNIHNKNVTVYVRMYKL